jgi:glycerate dehydrogenase
MSLANGCTMNIVLLDAYTANPGDLSWSEFHSLGHCIMHDRSLTPEAIIERCADAEVVITNKAIVSRAVIEALPKLRYIGVLATGYNIVDVTAAKERGIVVTNVPGYSSASVAQLVFALLLELTNHTGSLSRDVMDDRWTRSQDFCFWDKPLIELEGLTLGLVGLGDIGTAVAKIGLAFGMKVKAARRTWALPPPEGVEPTSLENVLSQSDVVSLHCPLTEDTRQLINATTLATMKPSAYLINTARGPLVDEAALAATLNADQLAGAGLDVLSVEPPKSGSPLFSAKNCVITPHVAWASRAARERLITKAAANISAWQEGKPINVVG